MRDGNTTEAELAFKAMSLQYPQFAAPLVNLAIIERKRGDLGQAEESLKSAVARERGSALAWTELGVTQRMRGEFPEALGSYEQALAADPRYAPAWRNLGVLADLYTGDPQRALEAFEKYKAVTGEEKPVSGWIAELRQRLGLPPAKRPESEAPAASPAAAPADAPAATPAEAPASHPETAPSPAEPAVPSKSGDNAAHAAAPGSSSATGV